MVKAVFWRDALGLAILLFLAVPGPRRVQSQVTDPCGHRGPGPSTPAGPASVPRDTLSHEQRRAHVADLTLRIEALEQRESALRQEEAFLAYWRMRRTGFWLVGAGFGLALGSGTLLLMSLGSHSSEDTLDTHWGMTAGTLLLTGVAVGTAGLMLLGVAPRRYPIVADVRALRVERRELVRERRKFDCKRHAVTLRPDVRLTGEQRVAFVLSLKL